MNNHTATPTPTDLPEAIEPSGEWKVGLFRSSADRRRAVRMVAQGAEQIAEFGAHRDFIRWDAAAISAAAPAAAPQAGAPVELQDAARQPGTSMPPGWDSDEWDGGKPRDRRDLDRVLREWNDTTGALPRDSGWFVETLGMMQDAYDLGAHQALPTTPQAGAESYPPLPDLIESVWSRIHVYHEAESASGQARASDAIDAAIHKLLRAYADATAALRARGAVPSDRTALAKRLIGEVVEADRVATAVCRTVAELPDRDSPPDWPLAMLVTSEELHSIVCGAIFDAAPAAPMSAQAPSDADGFGSAEHWKEKAQYWAGVAHDLRQQALRGEPVDGIVQPPAALPGEQDAARLDFIGMNRVALIPEFEGGWDAQVYEEDAEPSVIAGGMTVRGAIDAAMAAAKGRTDGGALWVSTQGSTRLSISEWTLATTMNDHGRQKSLCRRSASVVHAAAPL